MKKFWTHGVVAFLAAILGAIVHAYVPAIPASVVTTGATVILDQTVQDHLDVIPAPADVSLSVDATSQGG